MGKTRRKREKTEECMMRGMREVASRGISLPEYKVESLHTLRLESLKLVFQPLHKFLVNKL